MINITPYRAKFRMSSFEDQQIKKSRDNKVISDSDISVLSTDNTTDISNFITIGLLAKHFDESELTIRRVFKKLVKKGDLLEGKDFVKADFLNERNFVYKLNPEKFIELVKQSDITPDNKGDNTLISLKEKYLKKTADVGETNLIKTDNSVDNNLTSGDIRSKKEEQNSKTKSEKSSEKSPAKSDNSLISPGDNNKEFVDYLKQQAKQKDETIKTQEENLKEKDKESRHLVERLNRREYVIKNLIGEASQLKARVYLLEERNKKSEPEPQEFVPKRKGLFSKLFG